MTRVKTFTVGLPVTDLASAVEWYRRLLGEVEEVNPAPGVWEARSLPQAGCSSLRVKSRVRTWQSCASSPATLKQGECKR
jgi:hypothetical protein